MNRDASLSHSVMGEVFPVVEISTSWKTSVSNSVMALEARDLQKTPVEKVSQYKGKSVFRAHTSALSGKGQLRILYDSHEDWTVIPRC